MIRSDSQVMYNQTNAALLSLLFIREMQKKKIDDIDD